MNKATYIYLGRLVKANSNEKHEHKSYVLTEILSERPKLEKEDEGMLGILEMTSRMCQLVEAIPNVFVLLWASCLL
jgi:hypothetical protein